MVRERGREVQYASKKFPICNSLNGYSVSV